MLKRRLCNSTARDAGATHCAEAASVDGRSAHHFLRSFTKERPTGEAWPSSMARSASFLASYAGALGLPAALARARARARERERERERARARAPFDGPLLCHALTHCAHAAAGRVRSFPGATSDAGATFGRTQSDAAGATVGRTQSDAAVDLTTCSSDDWVADWVRRTSPIKPGNP